MLSLEQVEAPGQCQTKPFVAPAFFFFFFEIQVAIKHIRSFTSRSLAAPQGTFLFSDSMAALDKQPQSIRQGEKQVGAHTRKLLRFLNSSRWGWLCKLPAAKVPRGRGRCRGTGQGMQPCPSRQHPIRAPPPPVLGGKTLPPSVVLLLRVKFTRANPYVAKQIGK